MGCKFFKLRRKITTNELLLFFSVVCIYILATQVFDCLKIQFSLLDIEETSKLNDVIHSLAGSYLMGVFVYGLTVVYKISDERRRRKWEICDLFQKLGDANKYLDEESGTDFSKYYTIEWFKENYTKEINDQWLSRIKPPLERTNMYRHLMSEKELELLDSIRTNLCITVPNEFMSAQTIELNSRRLIGIYKSIRQLYNGILKEVNK